MPTRKLPNEPGEELWGLVPPCQHPEHDPPSMMVFEPGSYEHACPGCGRTFVFTVPNPIGLQ